MDADAITRLVANEDGHGVEVQSVDAASEAALERIPELVLETVLHGLGHQRACHLAPQSPLSARYAPEILREQDQPQPGAAAVGQHGIAMAQLVKGFARRQALDDLRIYIVGEHVCEVGMGARLVHQCAGRRCYAHAALERFAFGERAWVAMNDLAVAHARYPLLVATSCITFRCYDSAHRED